MLPKMVLQPLVENAIYHGVEDAIEHCTISVSALEKADMILLEVSDDGRGMSEERLAAVRNFKAKPRGHGIGLKNIKERLEMAFRGDCSFVIDSKLGQGTTIRIQIPKKKVSELDG